MKQKIKNYKVLLTLALAGLLLYGCQVEQELTNENLYEKEGVIMHKKLEELIKDTHFNTAFNKVMKPQKELLKKGNTASKTVMEEQYNFTIVDQPANVVSSGEITSYTFLIKRELVVANVFENLVVNIIPNEEPKAYLYKFESTVAINNLSFNPDTFVGTKTLTPIQYNMEQSKVWVGDGFVCVSVETWHCPNHMEHVPGCTGHGTTSYDCFSTPGGGGLPPNTGGGSNSSGSTGGSTTTTNPDVVVAPLPPCTTCPTLDESPCGTLTGNTNTPPFKQKFRNLNKQTVFDLPHESGFNEFIVNGVSQLVDGTPSGDRKMSLPTNATSATHVHNNNPQTNEEGTVYDGTVKILSPPDLQQLTKTLMFNNVAAGNTAAGTHIDMLSNEGIFSLVVMDNSLSYLADIAPVLNKLDKDYKDFAEIIILGDNTSAQRKEKLQKMLLGLLKKTI